MRTEKPVHHPWADGNLAKEKQGGLESPECTHLEGLGTFLRTMLKTPERNCY